MLLYTCYSLTASQSHRGLNTKSSKLRPSSAHSVYRWTASSIRILCAYTQKVYSRNLWNGQAEINYKIWGKFLINSWLQYYDEWLLFLILLNRCTCLWSGFSAHSCVVAFISVWQSLPAADTALTERIQRYFNFQHLFYTVKDSRAHSNWRPGKPISCIHYEDLKI